jgi:hypothetical protein
MSSYKNTRLPQASQKPEYLSAHAAARLAGVATRNRVMRHVEADAWMTGPDGKRWPLYARETIEQWITDGIRDGRCKSAGGAE